VKAWAIRSVVQIGLVCWVGLLLQGLAALAPSQCWPLRLGALIGACAAFMQAYLWAHPESFQRRLPTGHTLEQMLNVYAWVAVLVGAALAGFGDLLPVSYGTGGCS
jgi:hypothetical protein